LRKFQSDIPLKILFDAPTVGEMASAIAERSSEKLDEKALLQALNELESLSDEEANKLAGTRSSKVSR
jgi:hypothetical protein